MRERENFGAWRQRACERVDVILGAGMRVLLLDDADGASKSLGLFLPRHVIPLAPVDVVPALVAGFAVEAVRDQAVPPAGFTSDHDFPWRVAQELGQRLARRLFCGGQPRTVLRRGIAVDVLGLAGQRL